MSSSSQIAAGLLRGEILLKQKKFEEAVKSFQSAVVLEDGLRYNEPPDWKLPTRHYLGVALFEAGKYADSEKVYLEDLKINRENGWSLTGLQRCQHAQNKKSDVAATAKRFSKAWKNSDIAISSSRL